MTLTSRHWSRLKGNQQLREVREHLATAPDDDYAAVVAALAAHRTDPALRLTVSLLAPDERAWMDEVCAEHRTHQPNAFSSIPLLDVVTAAEHVDAIEVDRLGLYLVVAADLADLVHRVGPGAMPVIEHYLGVYLDNNEKKTLFKALASLPSDRAMRALLDRTAETYVVAYAMEAAANFPRRALRLIAERLPDADEDERKRLAVVLHSDPLILETALPLMDEPVRAAITAATAEHRSHPEAPAEAVPTLLTAPPWAAGAEREPVVVKGLEPVPVNRMRWAEGELEAWSAMDHRELDPYRGADWDRARWELETRDFAFKNGREQAVMLALAPPEIAVELLPQWKTDYYYPTEILERILANLGAAGADHVWAATGVEPQQRSVLLPVANLDVARLAADALVRRKTMRPFAYEWLDRHGADAAALLAPDALGKAKKRRDAAEAALRYLAATHGAPTVREAAAGYGDEAAAAIAELVDIDPLAPVGVPVPELGGWASPVALPQVLLNGREHALPDAAVRNLIVALALGTPEYDYPGIAVIAAACDRTALTRFSIALFELWLSAGAPHEDAWALTQLAHFGDEEAVRLLAPLIARWPGESQHQRAVKGLKVLGAIGTETALRAIHQIAEKAKFAAIKAEAGEQITAIAANLGLTAEQLADRLVPDFGLRDESTLVLDYGPRRFKVGFDESLKPFVTDMDGKPRKTLPKPGAKDDALLADAAYKRFAALRKDLRTIAADQVKRLERAMVQGRTWTLAEFDEHFVDHPLVWHLARRLVWVAETDRARTAFRLAEDKGATDVDENDFTLADDALIRLAHPAVMGEETAAWAEIFADYEILQPFPQLARPVMAFTEEELRTGRLARFEGVTVPVGKLLGLTSKGWDRAAPQDAGVEPGMWRRLDGSGFLVLGLDPGIWVGAIDQCPDQTLRHVVLSPQNLDGWRAPLVAEDFGPVDPVTASEALVALAKATDTA